MRMRVATVLAALAASNVLGVQMASQIWATNRIQTAVSGIYSNVYTRTQADERIVELAPRPGNYLEVSNNAMTAIQSLQPAMDYADRQISTGNTAFVEAVINCPVTLPPDSGQALGEFGTYGTLGALLAALAAAVAYLKRNKANSSDLRYEINSVELTNNEGTLADRASNVVVPEVTGTIEWIWSDGETGTPVYSNGYWTVQNASFQFDGPVPGSSSDAEIAFPLTDTKQFAYSHLDYDSDQFVITVDDTTIYATGEYDEEYDDTIVKTVEYNGNTYTLEHPFVRWSGGSVSNGTATLTEHVVSLQPTYGPTIMLTMPSAVSGHVRDLIARIDLSQAAGAPPVAFSGGSFEAVDGEMPELVKGVNLLSFTETAAGVFAVAYKEMKAIAQGGS